MKRLRRELEEARMKSAAGALDEALSRAVEVKGVRLVTLRADALERGQLRTLVDNLKQKLGEGVVVLASAQPEGKVALIAGVTPGLTKRIQAGKLVGAVAKLVGGSGGGKPEIAEAGGKDQGQIDAALKAAAGDCWRVAGVRRSPWICAFPGLKIETWATRNSWKPLNPKSQNRVRTTRQLITGSGKWLNLSPWIQAIQNS